MTDLDLDAIAQRAIAAANRLVVMPGGRLGQFFGALVERLAVTLAVGIVLALEALIPAFFSGWAAYARAHPIPPVWDPEKGTGSLAPSIPVSSDGTIPLDQNPPKDNL